MQNNVNIDIIIRTEYNDIFIKLLEFCKKEKIVLSRVFLEEEVRNSDAGIYILDYLAHKFRNKTYFDMFNSLPFNRENIKGVFVIGKRIRGKAGILKKTYFVDSTEIEKTLLAKIVELLNEEKNKRKDVFKRKLERIVELIERQEEGRKIIRKEFCEKHEICKRTLERDIKIIKKLNKEIENLNWKDYGSAVNKEDKDKTKEVKKIYRIAYLYMHILKFNEVISGKFCTHFKISQRTFGRDVLNLNTVLQDRQIEGFGGVFY
ncbi:MAG TPA: hypothetical protein PKN32_05950 [Bacteroidales bacterium]|nr:hypothetical protein [Bacteroidales bacterium]